MDTYLDIVAPVLTLLWALICLRIYTMISKENPGQRRFIAISGAIGAALIYLLAGSFVAILRTPVAKSSGGEMERIRIHSNP